VLEEKPMAIPTRNQYNQQPSLPLYLPYLEEKPIAMQVCVVPVLAAYGPNTMPATKTGLKIHVIYTLLITYGVVVVVVVVAVTLEMFLLLQQLPLNLNPP
jgi:hypothetical protein